MIEAIIELIEVETGKKATPETTLEQLDIESLDFLDLLLTIQEKFGVIIPDSVVAKINNVGDMAKAVAGTL